MLQKYLHVINSGYAEYCQRLGEYLNLSHTQSIKRIAIYNILQIVGWQ